MVLWLECRIDVRGAFGPVDGDNGAPWAMAWSLLVECALRFRPLARPIAFTAGMCLLLTACGSSSSHPAGASSAPPATRTLTVFLAGSLTTSFLQLSKQFEIDNPGVIVNFSSTVSADLATQIVAGAPADVFAPAGEAAMKTMVDAMKIDGSPVIFATNVLEIITAPGNPRGIISFADLARPDVKVSVCDPTAACGMETARVEKAAGVTLKPVSEKPSLDAVLRQVTTGQADAGLVYVTDVVAAAGSVQGVMFPESSTAVTDYPLAVVKGAREAGLAKEFMEFVTGPTGQAMLKAAGFGTR